MAEVTFNVTLKNYKSSLEDGTEIIFADKSHTVKISTKSSKVLSDLPISFSKNYKIILNNSESSDMNVLKGFVVKSASVDNTIHHTYEIESKNQDHTLSLTLPDDCLGKYRDFDELIDSDFKNTFDLKINLE